MINGGKEFFDLVKSIGESKSKQEEDRIIFEEVSYLKRAFSQSSLPKKKLKELVIRSLYVEMLGQDASFAYIKAVELCASSEVSQKRVGYLAAGICFSPTHEFRFMLVNQIQRDLNSSNILEVVSGLSAVNKIVTEDMIPAVITNIIKLLKHDHELIRKKAICALHRLYQIDHKWMQDHYDKLRRMICDKDPSVMGASLPLLYDIITHEKAVNYKDLVPSLVSILKQLVDHRLPKDFDYHRIPAPWIQMQLLKILALLGKGDQKTSEEMYEVLADVMRRADTGINVGYALVYEAVTTVTTIYPNTILLDAAATSISRFIRSDSNNLKYIGIKGLATIVRDHPRYAADHQMAVIDCLEDSDETLKRKTLDLLFRMTNAVNVEFIVDKLLYTLETHSLVGDDHFKQDLIGQITHCAERYAPSNTWYVNTIIRLFEIAGDKVKSIVAQTLMSLLAEGSAESAGGNNDNEQEDGEDEDTILRREAVEHILQLIHKPKLAPIFIQMMVWILGEYGYLSYSTSKEMILDQLCDLCQQNPLDDQTRSYIITAMMKLVAQTGKCPLKVKHILQLYKQSRSIEIAQRCHEFEILLQHSTIMADVLPIDASCEEIEVDEYLSFLNDFVQQALAAGASPYNPPSATDTQEEPSPMKIKDIGLKIDAYEKPQIPTNIPLNAATNLLTGLTIATNTTNGHTVMTSSNSSSSSGGVLIQGSSNTILTSSPSLTSQGNQLLNYRTSTQVWGRNIDPVPNNTPIKSTSSSSQNTPLPTSPIVNTQVLDTNRDQAQSPTFGQSTSIAQLQLNSPPPREKTEKEKMAEALFGGLINTNTTPLTTSAMKGKSGGGGGGKLSSVSSSSSVNSIKPTSVSSSNISKNSNDPLKQSPILLSSSPIHGQSSPLVSLDVSPVSKSQSLSAPTRTVETNNDILSLQASTDTSITNVSTSDIMQTLPINNLVATQNIGSPPHSSNTTVINSANKYDNLTDSILKAYNTPTITTINGGSSSASNINTMTTSATASNITPTAISILKTETPGGISNSNVIILPRLERIQLYPLQLTTDTFGQNWVQLSAEIQTMTNTKITTLSRLIEIMPKTFYHVESIPTTYEAIFASSSSPTISTSNPTTTTTTTTSGNILISTILLVHIQLQPEKRLCSIMMKSTDKRLCEEQSQGLRSHISQV